MSVHKDEKTSTWYAHVWYHDWKNERKRKLKRGFKTKKEALEWERNFLMQYSDDLSMTFSQFLQVYEEDRRPRLKYNTWLSKMYIINDKLLPYFGDLDT